MKRLWLPLLLWATVASAQRFSLIMPMNVDVVNQTDQSLDLNLAHSSSYRSGDGSSGDYDLLQTHVAANAQAHLTLKHRYDSDDFWYINFTRSDGYYTSEMVQCDLESEDWEAPVQVRLIIHADAKHFDLVTPNHRCTDLELKHPAS